MKKFQIGLFTSAWDKVAILLVEEVHRNVQNGLIPNSEITFVFVSREEGETHFGNLMIQKIKELEIPLITFSSLNFKPELKKTDRESWRSEHDREVMKLLPKTDLDVLLGYMWVVSEEFCQKRIAINLHPALPTGPKGTYREVIWQLIKERASETGLMIHLVTPELDRGPAITFSHFSIRGDDFDSFWQEMEKRLEKESLEEIAEKEKEDNSLFKLIRQRGVIREFPIVIRTIKILAERKIEIKNSRIIDPQGQILERGYDLTEEIDVLMKEKEVE